MCSNRHFVMLPTEQLGEPRMPPYPHRVRSFIYGCAIALQEIEARNR